MNNQSDNEQGRAGHRSPIYEGINVERTLIEVGKTYGKIKVISVADNQKYKRYNCCCVCGKNVLYNGQEISKYKDSGCITCREAARNIARLERARKNIGMRSGELEVIDISGLRHYNGRNTVYAVCQCNCGNIIDIPLSKITAKQTKSCGHSRKTCLQIGNEILKNDYVHGTCVSSIDGRRRKNRNNTTGHTGICRVSNSNTYRAYIYFRGKQYHLGVFNDMDSAIQARKNAEKHIYGEFLEWYELNKPVQ